MKNILIFSNGEKIGDGLIKLPLLHEIKKRLPNTSIHWMTNQGKTVYNSRLKNIASQYIDKIYEKANLQFLIWKKISDKYDLENMNFDCIFDTQKAVLRTIALRRIQSKIFVSASASGFLSTKKIKKNKRRKYYLDSLLDLLDLIEPGVYENDFKILLPDKLMNKLKGIFKKNYSYIGYGVGAGEKDRIWHINNFIEVAKHFEKINYKNVFFLGPEEDWLKDKIKNIFPDAIYPEENIRDYSGPEIVMGATKFLKCALSNDSGIGHMLSTKYCPLIKIFGPKDSSKFTPVSSKIIVISSQSYGSKNIDKVPYKDVIKLIENEI